MILIRAQLGKTTMDFITNGNNHWINEVYSNGTVIHHHDVNVVKGNLLYKSLLSNGAEVAVYVNYEKAKVTEVPPRAFCSGRNYYNHA